MLWANRLVRPRRTRLRRYAIGTSKSRCSMEQAVMIAALALSLAAPEARLESIADRLRTANAELCRQNACPAPVLGKTSRCGWAERRTVTIDRACFAKLSDDEAAFVVAHEHAHTMGIKSEQAADWVGWAMMLRAGFDPVRANRIYVTLKVRPRIARGE